MIKGVPRQSIDTLEEAAFFTAHTRTFGCGRAVAIAMLLERR
jgi:hypothetical protein